MGEKVKGEQVSQMSQSDLGRALGLSPAAITKLKKQGMPVVSVDAAQAWRLARQSVARRKPQPATVPLTDAGLRPMSDGASVPLSDAALRPMGEGAYARQPESEYNTARTRREKAEAEIAELRLAEQLGLLINAAHVRAALAKRVAGLREAMLQLPARVVPLLAASPDASSMDKILRAEIVAALAQLTESAE
jgi:phage terminase Nu1 subunit (DNA packaging protein)